MASAAVTVKSFGVKGRAAGQFDAPWSLDFSRDGTKLYIVDCNNARLQVLDHATGQFSLAEGRVGNVPIAATVAPSGEFIAVLDSQMSDVIFLNPDTSFKNSYSPARLQSARGMCISTDSETIWFTSDVSGKATSFQVSDLKTPVTQISGLANPESIRVTSDGSRVLIAERDKNCVSIFSAVDGSAIKSFGSQQLRKPTGLAVDDVNSLVYVSSSADKRIDVYNLDGQHVRTIAHDFRSPQGLALSPDATLLAVADSGNNRICIFSL